MQKNWVKHDCLQQKLTLQLQQVIFLEHHLTYPHVFDLLLDNFVFLLYSHLTQAWFGKDLNYHYCD